MSLCVLGIMHFKVLFKLDALYSEALCKTSLVHKFRPGFLHSLRKCVVRIFFNAVKSYNLTFRRSDIQNYKYFYLKSSFFDI